MDAAQEARCKEMLDQILAMATKMASDLKSCNAELKSCSAAFRSAPPAFVVDPDSGGREVDATASNLVTLPSASPAPSPTSVPDLSMGAVTTNGSAEQALASCGIFDRDGDSIAMGTGAPVVADNWGGLFDEVPAFAYDYEPVSVPATVSDNLPVVPLEVVRKVAVALPHGSKSPCHDSELVSTAGKAAATVEFTVEREKVQIEARPVSPMVPFEKDAVRILELEHGVDNLSAPRPPRLRQLQRAPLRPPSFHRPRRAPPRSPRLRRQRRVPPRRRGRPPRFLIRGHRPRARALLPQPGAVHHRVRAPPHQRRWRARRALHTGSSTVSTVKPAPYANLLPTKCSMQILNSKSSSSMCHTLPITPAGNLSIPLAALSTMIDWTRAKEAVSSTMPIYITIYSSYSVDVVLSSCAFEKHVVQKAHEGLLAQDTLRAAILGDSIQLWALPWPSFPGYAAIVLLNTSRVFAVKSKWRGSLLGSMEMQLSWGDWGPYFQWDGSEKSVQVPFLLKSSRPPPTQDAIGGIDHWPVHLLLIECSNGTGLLLPQPWSPSAIHLHKCMFVLDHTMQWQPPMMLDVQLQKASKVIWDISILNTFVDSSKCRAQWKPPWVSFEGGNIAGYCHTSSFIIKLRPTPWSSSCCSCYQLEVQSKDQWASDGYVSLDVGLFCSKGKMVWYYYLQFVLEFVLHHVAELRTMMWLPSSRRRWGELLKFSWPQDEFKDGIDNLSVHWLSLKFSKGTWLLVPQPWPPPVSDIIASSQEETQPQIWHVKSNQTNVAVQLKVLLCWSFCLIVLALASGGLMQLF